MKTKKLKSYSILSNAYNLHQLNSLNGDWDRSNTEALYISLVELSDSDFGEHYGLRAAYDALQLVREDESDMAVVMWEGMNIEPSEFPQYLLEQEPDFHSVCIAQASVKLMADSVFNFKPCDQKIVCNRISETLQDLDILGEESVKGIFMDVLGRDDL